jgi:hypothetical protein
MPVYVNAIIGYMGVIKNWAVALTSPARLAITGTAITLLILLSGRAYATPYGSGAYDSCSYQQDCSNDSGHSSNGGSSSTGIDSGNEQPDRDQPSSSSILLNDFPEYFDNEGKLLTAQVGAVHFFEVLVGRQAERHSVTILEILEARVRIVVASDPIEAELAVGQTKIFDVSGDNQDDIAIELIGVKNATASLRYQALANDNIEEPASTNVVQPINKSYIWIFYSVLALLGVFGLIILWFRRRHSSLGDSQS